MANARSKVKRAGTKGSSGRLAIETRQVPGFLGRSAGSVKTRQGRTGYTEEKRLGPGSAGRSISLPTE